MNKAIVEHKLRLLMDSFEASLYDEDETFMKNMEKSNLAGDNVLKYKYWEWTQGVGLYGLWKIYERTNEQHLYDVLINYYERQLKIGLPAKNINTTAPLLALTYVYEKTRDKRYYDIMTDWAEWLITSLPKTCEGGFQHLTSDTLNNQELWDDTLFMAVLFLARMGKIMGRRDYIDEAEYQFVLHAKYLADKVSGLWYHGWTFEAKNNFAGAFWGRGNSWITIAIPELYDMVEMSPVTKRILSGYLAQQINALIECQDDNGMWHTVINDKTSYVEASATSGFGYGILRAVRMGIVDKSCVNNALRALVPITSYIDETGVLGQVSYGTPMGRESVQFYKDIPLKSMPYGQAMAILFLVESIDNL